MPGPDKVRAWAFIVANCLLIKVRSPRRLAPRDDNPILTDYCSLLTLYFSPLQICVLSFVYCCLLFYYLYLIYPNALRFFLSSSSISMDSASLTSPSSRYCSIIVINLLQSFL